ncbi:kinase domain protein, partial (macronuclear) [Tetrahymena thermophila SB210]
QLSQLACHLLTCLFTYLLKNKQNITNFFTYSSQHNQNTNESHSFFTILSPPYLFIQFVIYSYIQRQNNIGDDGAKDLGTGIAQCKNITTLNLYLDQLSQLACHLLTCLFTYLLKKKQNITNFFTYSSQHNQNTNESHSFFTILSPPYLFIQFVIYCYIQRQNNIGDDGAKDLGTGIAQCKNITTLNLYLDYQLIKPACLSFTNLLIYLFTQKQIKYNEFLYLLITTQLKYQRKPQFFYHPFSSIFIYLIRYLLLYLKFEQYWCIGCQRFRHRNSLVQEYHNFGAIIIFKLQFCDSIEEIPRRIIISQRNNYIMTFNQQLNVTNLINNQKIKKLSSAQINKYVSQIYLFFNFVFYKYIDQLDNSYYLFIV